MSIILMHVLFMDIVQDISAMDDSSTPEEAPEEAQEVSCLQ
jgi:hypothetical protein